MKLDHNRTEIWEGETGVREKREDILVAGWGGWGELWTIEPETKQWSLC